MPDTPLICHDCWGAQTNHSEPCPHTMGIVNHFHQKIEVLNQQLEEWRPIVEAAKVFNEIYIKAEITRQLKGTSEKRFCEVVVHPGMTCNQPMPCKVVEHTFPVKREGV